MHGSNVVKSAHEFRCELYDRLIAVSGELRKVNNDATKANWVRAQLEALKNNQGQDAKRKKQGWSAKPVNSPAKKQPPVIVDSEPLTDTDA
jgi:hypothetical protein